MEGHYKKGKRPRGKGSCCLEQLEFMMKLTRKVRRAEQQMRKSRGEKRNPLAKKEGLWLKYICE